MDKVIVTVCGKINLSLNILGKESSMHTIDSVMQSVSLADTVTAMSRRDNRVNITFIGDGAEFIDKDNNSVKKTVEYLQNIFGDFGAELVVEKGIPLSGGMGGSSAGAAGTLIALNRLFDFDKRGLKLTAAAASLGSDVSFMTIGGCARVTGTGEKIERVTNNLPLYIVASHDGGRVNSHDVYNRFDTLCPSLSNSPSDNDRLIKLLGQGDAGALRYAANALEPASQSLCGKITNVKDVLTAAGAFATVMTGSGGVSVGFFIDMVQADLAAAALRKSLLWAKSCYSTNTGVKILEIPAE